MLMLLKLFFMNKPIVTFIGFLLLILGMLNLTLVLVGVQLAPFVFLDFFGRGIGFLIKILMIIFGIAIIVVSRSAFDGGTMPEQK